MCKKELIKMTKFLSFACLIVFLGCNKNNEDDCVPPEMCTEEFVSITIAFEKPDGQPVVVRDYQVRHLSNGKILQTDQTGATTQPGTYVVSSDRQLDLFSDSGAMVEVSGKDPVSGKTGMAKLKIRGGKCNCHVSKLSGPEKILFD
jgi:hypothetical protein